MDSDTTTCTAEDVRPDVNVANYFSPTPGTVWGPRRIPDFELILAVSGRCRYSEESDGWRESVVEAGQVLSIPPETDHIFKIGEEPGTHTISCLHLEPVKGRRWIEGGYRLEPPPLLTDVGGDFAVHELFARAAETFSGVSKHRACILEKIAAELWLRLAEYWEGGHVPRPSPLFKAMKAYLDGNLTRKLSRRDLAREFKITPEHVNAVFKRELGVSPTQYVHRSRVYLACRCLREEGLGVKETAGRVGFEDEFHFSKVFKKVTGQSPNAFRGHH